jgi:hypothetical protein
MTKHAEIEFVLPDNVSIVKTVTRPNRLALVPLVIALAILLVIMAGELITTEAWSKIGLLVLIPSLVIVVCGSWLSFNLWQQIQYLDVHFERHRASNRVLRSIFLDVRSKEPGARELLFDNLLHGMLWVDYETFGSFLYDIHPEDVRAFRDYCYKKKQDMQPGLREHLARNPDPDHPRGAVSSKENDDMQGILDLLDEILAA